MLVFKKKSLFNKITLIFDFGSCYTRVVANGQLVFNQPTCFLIDLKKEAVLSLGDQAQIVLGKEPSHTSVVYPIQQGVIADQLRFKQFLTGLLEQLKKQLDWSWLSRVEAICVMTEAATQLDKKIMTQSLSSAGMSSVKIISKAEALLAKFDKSHASISGKSQIVILDIGDQITELVMGSKEAVSFAASLNTGSQNLTRSIQDCLKKDYDLLISFQQATKIKHHLRYDFITQVSEKERTGKSVVAGNNLNIRGVDLQERTVITKTIKASDLLKSIEQELGKLLHQVKRTLSLATSEQLVTSLNNGLVLTGGGSRFFGLDDFFAQQLQVNVLSSGDSLYDVVFGAQKIAK